jgi:hypothetical protein
MFADEPDDVANPSGVKGVGETEGLRCGGNYECYGVLRVETTVTEPAAQRFLQAWTRVNPRTPRLKAVPNRKRRARIV